MVGIQPRWFFARFDVRLTLLGIIGRQRHEDEFRFRSRHLDDDLGELPDRELARIAEIDRAGEVAVAVHQPHEAVDQIVDVAEGARLAAVAVDGDGLALQGLHDEIGDDAAVVGVHARAVGIEDARDLDLELVLAVIVEEQRLGAALALVIAGARADRVDVPPVVFRLRMHGRVAVDLAGRGLQDPAAQAAWPGPAC